MYNGGNLRFYGKSRQVIYVSILFCAEAIGVTKFSIPLKKKNKSSAKKAECKVCSGQKNAKRQMRKREKGRKNRAGNY